MKRDMDLIRLLLLELERDEKTDLSSYSDEQIKYHKSLLIEAGLARGSVMNNGSGNVAAAMLTRLTWEGHEFLDAAKNNSIWNKAKELISKSNLSITFPVLRELLTMMLKEQLGIK